MHSIPNKHVDHALHRHSYNTYGYAYSQTISLSFPPSAAHTPAMHFGPPLPAGLGPGDLDLVGAHDVVVHGGRGALEAGAGAHGGVVAVVQRDGVLEVALAGEVGVGWEGRLESPFVPPAASVAPARPRDPKFGYPFYLFKALSALDCEISNKATHGP
jgi:hypothetical protein